MSNVPISPEQRTTDAKLAEAAKKLRAGIRREHDTVCLCPFDGTDDGCNWIPSGQGLALALADFEEEVG